MVGVYPSQTFTVFMYWDPQSVSENTIFIQIYPASSVLLYLPNMLLSLMWSKGAKLVFKFFISSFAVVQTPTLMQPTPEMNRMSSVEGKLLNETKSSATGRERSERSPGAPLASSSRSVTVRQTNQVVAGRRGQTFPLVFVETVDTIQLFYDLRLILFLEVQCAGIKSMPGL